MEIYNGKYCVYAHINKTNGKIYIGQTCQKPHRRWRDGDGYTENPHLYSAIQKYGWDGFDHEIIASNLTLAEANNFESLLIGKFDTMNPDKGYNLQSGGDNCYCSEETKMRVSEAGKGRKVSDETRKKLSEVKMGENNPMYGKRGELNPLYGKTKSEEHRKHLSESHIGLQIGEKHPMYGKHHSEESRAKMRESHKGIHCGERHPMYGKHPGEQSKQKNMMSQKTRKIIICVETGIVYNSQAELARQLEVAPGSVSYAIKVGKDIKGYHFKLITNNTRQND